jgi:serine/threonine protein kinase
MKSSHFYCDERLLLTVLRSELPQEEQERLSAHLAECKLCQKKLSDLAASEDEWSAASDAMKEYSLSNEDGMWRGSEVKALGPQRWTESLAKQLLSPPRHPEMLGRLGRYEIERLIGAGGMGLVFKAFDHELNRPLAIKMLSPHLGDSGAARQRFAREARAAAAVVHPHVVPIHNVDSDGELPYLVMQYVSGESLQDRIDREGPLELEQILRIGMQVADGLEAAHQQGLVHRDIKPSNILLEDRVERALITDFGLARAGDDASLTRTGFHPGTPHYMSPEQASGKTVDARSDLFSLGSMFYAMSTGRPPFRDESSLSVMRLIAESAPPPMTQSNSRLPEWWVVFVERLMAKSPSERFASASEVKAVLKECLRHFESPASVTVPKVLQRTLWFSSKPSFSVAGGLGMLGLLFCGFLWFQNAAKVDEDKSGKETTIEYIDEGEKNFYQLIESLDQSHGDWLASVVVEGDGDSETFSGSFNSDGPIYDGTPGSGFYVQNGPGFPEDHRISIAWPQQNPQQGIIISLSTSCDYYRDLGKGPKEFFSDTQYKVMVSYYDNEDLETAKRTAPTYGGNWDPQTRILTCEIESGVLQEGGYDEWVKANTFQMVFEETGEIQIRNLPLREDGKRKLSAKIINQISKAPRTLEIDRTVLSSLGGGGYGDEQGEYGLSLGISVNDVNGKAIEIQNIVLLGTRELIVYGATASPPNLLTKKEGVVTGYFIFDRSSGKFLKDLSLEGYRNEMELLGLSAPRLYTAKEVLSFGKIDRPVDIFPWYKGFHK